MRNISRRFLDKAAERVLDVQGDDDEDEGEEPTTDRPETANDPDR